MARGISGTGAGFDAPAAGKVGGRFVGRADDVPAHRLRDLGAQAAEARLRRQAVMPVGPRTLGGLWPRWACGERAGSCQVMHSCCCTASLLHAALLLSHAAAPPTMQAATRRCASSRPARRPPRRQSAGGDGGKR